MRYVSHLLLRALAASICCAAALAIPAAAQPAAKPAPAMSPHPGMNAMPGMSRPPAILPSGPVDPAKVAAAKAFIIVYHPRQDPKDMAKRLDEFMPRMIASAKEDDPKLDVKKFEREKRAQIMAQINQGLDSQARIVSKYFTLQELNGLTAFFRNGLGKKLTEVTPKIQMEIMMEMRKQRMKAPLPGMKPLKVSPPAAAPKKPGTP
jgi:hypothetical protein